MKIIMTLLAVLGLNPSVDTDKISPKEMMCLTKAVYHEARGEPAMGQVAVAHVIKNRVESQRYPDTVCEVVYQEAQFTNLYPSTNYDTNSRVWEEVAENALLAYTEFVDDPTQGSLWYYAHQKIAKPWWAKSKRVVAVIGGHTFLTYT